MNPYIVPGLIRDLTEVSVKDVAEKVSCFCRVPMHKFFQRNRKKEVVSARHILIWILRKKLMMTCTDIAKYLDLDHTTVLHSVKRVEDQMDVYQDYREDIDDLVSIIKGTKSLYIRGVESKTA